MATLIDMKCLGPKGLVELNKYNPKIQIIEKSSSLKTDLKVHKLILEETLSNEELDQFANSSKCIVGISNDVEYHANASFNDPSISKQTQHSFLNTEDFYNNASWLPVLESEKAVIAVIDTGVDYNHPDLKNVIYRENGKMVGASFVPGNSDFLDDHGHGTHVAGLAASEANNNEGGMGVCGLSCKIMPIKVLSAKGSGTLSDIVNGVFWAVDHGAHILNLSLGRSINFVGMAPLELEAYRYAMKKNVIVVVAAGNDGALLSKTGLQSWPAMFAPLAGLISVASVDAATGDMSTFSNRSSSFVEIAAPGSTRSTNGTYTGLLSTAKGGGYVSMSGTSMATPVVAGSLGLIVNYYKKFKIPYSVWDAEALLKSATNSNPNFLSLVEAGRVLNLSVLGEKLKEAQGNPYRLDLADRMESFIVDLYYVMMRRNYDVGGAQFNLGLMKDHKIPVETMMLNFFNSAEFVNSFGGVSQDVDNGLMWETVRDHFIPDSYLVILGRLPNSQELDYWAKYIMTFKNKSKLLIENLLQSSEFKNKISGTSLENYPLLEKNAMDINNRCLASDFKGDLTLTSQIEYGYCFIFERKADEGGRNFFVDQLKNGASLQEIYLSFLRSQEFADKNEIKKASNRDYINILYYLILQRSPADYEAYSWVSLLDKNISREEVLKAFIYSEEFNSLLNKKSVR